MRVRVKLNINESKKRGKRIYSVAVKTANGWKVNNNYVESLYLVNCKAVYIPSKYRAILAKKQKDVYAFVEGTVTAGPLNDLTVIRCNPFIKMEFYIESTGAVQNIFKSVTLNERGMTATI